jgi:ABC-type transport system involved in cytochrome c biogenesis permease subunit
VVDVSALYFLANLTLFALLLLSWGHLLRPVWVAGGLLRATTLLFLCCQAVALLWSVAQLGPWCFAHPYLSAMLLVEVAILVCVVLRKLGPDGGAGPFVVTLAFLVHSFGIMFVLPPAAETLQISPFARSPWYLLHVVTALVTLGAYTCAAGGALAYFGARVSVRGRFAGERVSRQRSLVYCRRALVIGFSWLTSSMLASALWTQLTWGSYWTWRPAEAWLLILWLVLTMALHARSMPAWQGKPVAFLSLLGFTFALLSLPLLGQGLLTTS